MSQIIDRISTNISEAFVIIKKPNNIAIYFFIIIECAVF